MAFAAAVGKYGSSTDPPGDEELEKIAAIRSACHAELGALPECDDVSGELRVCRFLRAKAGDVKLATEHFRAFLRWRAESDVEEWRKEVIGRSPPELLAWYGKRCNPYVPFSPCVGRTDDGLLLYFVRSGMMEPRKFVDHRPVPVEADTKTMAQVMEWTSWYLNLLSRREGRLVYRIGVYDFSGLGEGRPLPIFVPAFQQTLTQWIKAGQRYCEHDAAYVMINTSPIFRAMISAIKLALTKRQNAKIRVLGDVRQASVRAKLEEYVPQDLIPAVYGGRLKQAINAFPLLSEEEIRTWYEQRPLVTPEFPSQHEAHPDRAVAAAASEAPTVSTTASAEEQTPADRDDGAPLRPEEEEEEVLSQQFPPAQGCGGDTVEQAAQASSVCSLCACLR